MIISIVVVLLVAALFAVLICKSKHSDLFKWIGVALFIGILLTWIIPYGYFSSGSFYEYGMKRLGLSDIPTIAYYAIYFCLMYVVYFLAVGGFYGVVSKTKGYAQMVTSLAKKVKENKLVSAICMMVILIGLTSVLKSAFVLVLFVPFLISILSKAKFDKITTMGLTFGSILVGLMCATYGTEGLYWFNSYVGIEGYAGIGYRAILAGVTLLLFVGFNVYRILKLDNKKTKDLKEVEDLYEVAEVKSKAQVWPYIVIFGLLFVVAILGYFDWAGILNIKVFDSFHEMISNFTVTIGEEENAILLNILGSSAVAFGTFEVQTLVPFILAATILVGVIGKVKFNEFGENYAEGFGKMLKPVIVFVASYAVFIICYMSPFMAYISNFAFGLTENFNGYITALVAFISSIFHSDLGYTGYVVGSVLTTTYAEHLNVASTIYVFTYGLAQLFMPVGGLLLVGLSYLKLDYKEWFKYIWKFVVAAVVVLALFITVVMYII